MTSIAPLSPAASTADDNAWLIPLIGGSVLALLLAAALLLVLMLGRRR